MTEGIGRTVLALRREYATGMGVRYDLTIATTGAVRYQRSGTQARTTGLIDQYGSIADAMDEARHRAGIAATTEIEVVHWPHTDTGLAGLLSNLSAAVPRPLSRLLSSLPSSLWNGDATLAELPWRNATGANR